MNIAFDAKRAYHNNTGLGVFSRVLIGLLARQYPQHEYFLCNPKPGNLFTPSSPNIHEMQPQQALHKLFTNIWRSKWVVQDLKKIGINIYHGLSHEIPVNIDKTDIRSVVTMHDMFPEIYPEQYNPIDAKIYRSKSRYACKHADRIMAISEETKKHINDIYKIDAEKIDVIYQSCPDIFYKIANEGTKESIRKKYNLPQNFFLHVGTIIERKNLLNICKAMNEIRHDIEFPLVVVGKGGAYKTKVQQYIKENNLQERVIFLSDRLAEAGKKPFIETEDFPAIYQMAAAMIYPSFYEGFGIPVAEALASGTPVITSNTSCLPEVGGSAAFYVNPSKPEEMAEGFRKIYNDKELAASMREKGFIQAKRFAPETYASQVMCMYENVMK